MHPGETNAELISTITMDSLAWIAIPDSAITMLRQVLLPCAAAFIVVLSSLALILHWSRQEDIVDANTDSEGSSEHSVSAKRGMLSFIGLGALEALTGTPWAGGDRSSSTQHSATMDHECGVLRSTGGSAAGLAQARTRLAVSSS